MQMLPKITTLAERISVKQTNTTKHPLDGVHGLFIAADVNADNCKPVLLIHICLPQLQCLIELAPACSDWTAGHRTHLDVLPTSLKENNQML